jgi:integrase
MQPPAIGGNDRAHRRRPDGARVSSPKAFVFGTATGEYQGVWDDLRHEAAFCWLAHGLDLRSIQLLLGHADLKRTQGMGRSH